MFQVEVSPHHLPGIFSYSPLHTATQSIFLSRDLQTGLPGIKKPAKALLCLSHKILPCLTCKSFHDLVPFYLPTSASHDPLTCALHWCPAVIFSQLPASPGSWPMWLTETGWHVHLEGSSTLPVHMLLMHQKHTQLLKTYLRHKTFPSVRPIWSTHFS